MVSVFHSSTGRAGELKWVQPRFCGFSLYSRSAAITGHLRSIHPIGVLALLSYPLHPKPSFISKRVLPMMSPGINFVLLIDRRRILTQMVFFFYVQDGSSSACRNQGKRCVCEDARRTHKSFGYQ